MPEATFKAAVCDYYSMEETAYPAFALRHSLTRRMRILYPFVQVLHPDFLFNERRLIERVAKASSLREIQEEIDFYHHKFVVSSITRDALRLRVSGMQLMHLANKVFNQPRY
ncbi:MAG: hypothetical protein R6V45_08890 [Oceanipulchritudo sp.]